MTRNSIREYIEAIRWRYLRATKKQKGKILEEFVQVTGYHRKSAIRLLHHKSQVYRANDVGVPSAMAPRGPGIENTLGSY